MTRQHPPTAGADPLNSVARHRYRQDAVQTPGELARRLGRLERGDQARPRTRPVVSGSRSDGTALASLLRALHDAGAIDDRTED